MIPYTLFLLAVGAGRLIEMLYSRRNQRALMQQGKQRIAERYFGVMVAVHLGVLIGSLLEVMFLARPFIPLVGVPMIAVFSAANLLRWWVIHTLAHHWNVQIMDSLDLGVVTSGAYRYIRHPNYSAVIAEMIAIPLIHSAWLTALIMTPIHLWVIYQRVRAEEAILMKYPAYQQAMGDKPRFLPRWHS